MSEQHLPSQKTNSFLSTPTGEHSEQNTERRDASTVHGEAKSVVWTPRFSIFFFLILALGLSSASMLVQGWLNGIYPYDAILLAWSGLLFVTWLVVTFTAYSSWIRIGGVFACLWCVFMATMAILYLQGFDVHNTTFIHASSTVATAFLGASLSLSLAHTPQTRWDTWFFRLAPLSGLALAIVLYLRAPFASRSPIFFESTLVTPLLILCIAIWWLRPSCWRIQCSNCILFGGAAFIQLLLTTTQRYSENGFFFTQVLFIALLLSALRILQRERLEKHLSRN